MANSTQGGAGWAVIHQGAFDADAIRDVQDSFYEGRQTVLTGATDPIPFPGTVQLNSGSADACTLATPAAGPQPLGDDGKTVTVYDNSGKAHTITTAANKIINSKHVATFNGTVGSNITLQALSGIWVVLGTANGVALT
jgi:hypothetical protein